MHASPSPKNHRARWAAIGAAVAVSLGAGGLGIVNAVTPTGASAYVPVTPCRIIDTRPGSGQVGPQNSPLGPDGIMTVDGWGDVAGDCNLPSNSTGLQLNVTAVNATQATFLTLYPEGGTRPTASNVNVDNASATPNAATVTLNATNGKFHVFNRFGSVNVVIDVAGYFAGHQHDSADIIDNTLTGTDILNNSVQAVDIDAEAGVAYTALNPTDFPLDATQSIASVKVGVPADGYVTAIAEIGWFASGAATADRTRCQLTKGTTFDSALPWFRLNDIYPETDTGFLQTTTGHRTFEVSEADNTGSILTGIGQNIHVVCEADTGTVTIGTVNLTVMYFPTEYIAGPLVFFPFDQQVEGE